MAKTDAIIEKLEGFIKKYYLNELLKGAILFVALGLLYFIVTVFLEYFFWLGKTVRLILFWAFILVEVGLFVRFIIFPLLKLFKISKGINYEDAARIIGKHFPEVDDKLLNFLQLKQVHTQSQSDLLLAGIEQKTKELHPVPFQIAVDFKSNLPYLKYALIPIFIVFAIWFSGQIPSFSDSYSRVVNYKQAYEPPAPFQFYVLNDELKTQENENFELLVHTKGNVVPENVKIHYGEESFLLKNNGVGEFTYAFDKLDENTDFYLEANGVKSRNYLLEIVNVPKLLDFKLRLKYPAYLGKSDEIIKGTGNATLPEGTEIIWDLTGKNTDQVQLNIGDSIHSFDRKNDQFLLEETIRKPFDYEILASNQAVDNPERLSYRIKVIPDRSPEIEVDMKRDTVNEEVLYFKGNISDDHGLSALQLVYYPTDNRRKIKTKKIPIKSGNFDEFIYSFPATLDLEKGKAYELFFQVFDNDQVNGAKSAKSEVFEYHSLSDDQREEKSLKKQKEDIEDMSKSLQDMKKSESDFEEINQLQKENTQLDYNDRKKLADYLNKQKRDNELMKQFSNSMKENMDKEGTDAKNDKQKKAIKERLEENERRLQENEKLMEELENYKDKIKEEDLSKKLEQMAKNKKSQQRSLEELLELTKRYYIDQKLNKLGNDLAKMAEEQKRLSEEGDSLNQQDQEQLKENFDDFKNDFDDLEKENEELRNPKNLGRDKGNEEAVDMEQEDLLKMMEKMDNQEDKLDEEDNSHADKEQKQKIKDKQEKLGDLLKEMSERMKAEQQKRDKDQLMEDADMLRQILDNLLIFSFEQEDLMLVFREQQGDYLELANNLQYQQTLKENFKHVDDSLYALALRNPYLSETMNKHLGDINFNMDKALERLAKNNANSGTANQQYILTGANELANLLDESLQNMDSMLDDMEGGEGSPMDDSGSGEGKFQLDDIIKEQEELGGMGEENEEDGEGDDGGEGDSENGEEGENEGGEKGDGNDGNSEEMSAELFEIYKQQQKLRMELENRLQGEEEVQEKMLLREMENLEKNLLEDGFTEKSREIMKRIRDRMIRLQNAQYDQEQENERKAETNLKEFENKTKKDYERARDYFQTEEILNRQSLPLQPNFQEIIRAYFN